MTFHRFILALSAAATLGIAVLVALNARAVVAIEVSLQAGVQEYRERGLLDFNKANNLPDYKLVLRAADRWYDLGTKPDTSAWTPLRFPVAQAIPWQWAVELKLLDDNRLNDTLLEQVPIEGLTVIGDSYQYQITTAFRLDAGLRWLMQTSLGQALLIALILAALLIFLGGIGRITPE